MIIFLVICSLIIYAMIRNNQVCAFRISVIDEDGMEEYSKLPSYDHMFKSLKPLTRKYWLDGKEWKPFQFIKNWFYI